MKAKIIDFFYKVKNTFLKIYSNLKSKIIISFNKCKEGEESMKNIMVYWSVIPCILYLYIRGRFYFPKLIRMIFDIFALLLSVLDFYFIQKAVKIHPEYDSELMEELKKTEYYATLSEEELKKEKKKESLNNKKNFLKSIFNLGTQKKIDFYKIVRAFVVLVFLIALKRIVF